MVGLSCFGCVTPPSGLRVKSAMTGHRAQDRHSRVGGNPQGGSEGILSVVLAYCHPHL